MPSAAFEIHDPTILINARAVLDACRSAKGMQDGLTSVLGSHKGFTQTQQVIANRNYQKQGGLHEVGIMDKCQAGRVTIGLIRGNRAKISTNAYSHFNLFVVNWIITCKKHDRGRDEWL